jgi:hypothetical protein
MQEDIRDQLDAMALPSSGLSSGVIAACAVVFLLTIAVVAIWWVRRRKLHMGTPEEHARRCLTSIHTSDCRLFHAQLASVMVEYFESKLGLRSSRLTSAEILSEFRRNGVMSAEWQASLAKLFAECDRAKFSGATAVWDSAETLEHTQRLLDELAGQVATMPTLATPWKGLTDAAV